MITCSKCGEEIKFFKHFEGEVLETVHGRINVMVPGDITWEHNPDCDFEIKVGNK